MGSDLLTEIRCEIDERLRALQPAVEEYQALLLAAEAIEHDEPAADLPHSAPADPPTGAPVRLPTGDNGRAPRAPRTRAREDGGDGQAAAHEAILGALEHGSHTVAELVVVTGERTAPINRELRRLVALGLVAKTEREGKPAWSLVATGD